MKSDRLFKKKFITAVLTVVITLAIMLGNFLFTQAAAAKISSRVTIDGKKYTAIKASGGIIYPGTYALGADIELSQSIEISYIDDDDNPSPVIILLNGHTLSVPENADYPAITVSEGAGLIIREKEGAAGKISGCYSAIDIDNGTLTVENTEISGNTFGITAYNATVIITGDSELSGNGDSSDYTSASIYCGENTSVLIQDETEISGNETGIYLNTDTKLTVSGSVRIAGNNKAGILCCENQELYIEKGDDGLLLQLCINGGNGICENASVLLPETYKAYKDCFTGTNGDGISVIISDKADFSAIVKKNPCTGHKYTYTASGSQIRALCSVCGTSGVISLVNDGFTDETTSVCYVSSVEDEIYVDDSRFDSYKTTVYPQLLFTRAASGESGFEVPSEIGNYSVKLVLLLEKDNLASVISETESVEFQKTCEQHEWEYISGKTSISVRCNKCGGTFAKAVLNVNNFELTESTDDVVKLYECSGDELICEVTASGYNLGLGNFAIIYGYQNGGHVLYDPDYAADGDCEASTPEEDDGIEYSLEKPTEDGYYYVKLAVLKIPTRISSVIVTSEPILYEYEYHEWSYNLVETEPAWFCINANCSECKAHACVCLDSSELDASARNYVNTGEGEFSGNVFYETGWNEAKGIRAYKVLYRDCGSNEYVERKSKLNDNTNFFAKIILLERERAADDNDYSTQEKQFYFPTLYVDTVGSEVTIRSMSEDEMSEPYCYGDNEYYVSTAAELYWVASHASSSVTIHLTNNIVANPIMISDDGEAYSASKIVYLWPGIGSDDNMFTGSVYGNGYTITGIYCNNGSADAGIINDSRRTDTMFLNVKDSYFSGRYAGGIFGYIETSESSDIINIMGCKVTNCIIKSTSADTGAAGGIVGLIACTKEYSGYEIYDCICGNTVRAAYAGGILGKAGVKPAADAGLSGSSWFSFDLSRCVNTGDISGSVAAGGITGAVSGNGISFYTIINDCKNTGDIYSENAAGGLVGTSADGGNSGTYKRYLELNNCTSLGVVTCDGQTAGGLVGICDAVNSDGEKCISGSGNACFGAVYAVGGSMVQKNGVNTVLVTGSSSSDKRYNDYPAMMLTTVLARKANLCKGFRLDSNGNIAVYKDDNGTYSYAHVTGEWQVITAADCENGGRMVKKCIVCGEITETIDTTATGHRYSDGACLYCGAAGFDNIASAFSQPTVFLPVSAALIAAFCIAAIVYKRRKRLS